MTSSLASRRKILEEKYRLWTSETLWGRFSSTAERCTDKIFLETVETRYTYGEIHTLSLTLAHQLHGLGITSGSSVALIMDNRPEFVALTFAIAKLGAIKVALNSKLTPREWSYMLQHSDAEVLITSVNTAVQAKYLATLWKRFAKSGADPEFPKLRSIVSFGDEPETSSDYIQHWTLQDLSPLAPDLKDLASPERPSDILYTSGSMGLPKGVLLTHDILWRSAYANCLNRGFEIGRKIFVPVPLFHVYGYVEGLLAAILVEGSLVLTQQKCTGKMLLDTLRQFQANDILAVPSMMMNLLPEYELHPVSLPDLHAVYCSASACPAWLWGKIRSTLGIQELVTGYGMTEVYGATAQTAPDAATEILSATVGKVLSCGSGGWKSLDGALIQYKVVDPNSGQECPAGQTGELWCRGPAVTPGYYKDPESTRKAIDKDGWFHTNDLAYLTADKDIVLQGRVNDEYKINGENVSPQSVEEQLSGCEQIRYIEIVGVPDHVLGEVGAAFIELTDDGTPETVMEYCKLKLAHFQVPKYYFFSDRDSWPQTATGKVPKAKLRKLAVSLLDGTKQRGKVIIYGRS